MMLVHGEGHKMEFLKHKIRSEYKIECYMPANGQTAVVKTPVDVPVAVSRTLLDEVSCTCYFVDTTTYLLFFNYALFAQGGRLKLLLC